MSITKLSVAFLMLAVTMTLGCASKPKETGFLSTYKNLEPKGPTDMVYVGAKMGSYSKFMIDPIAVKAYDPKNMGKVNEKDLQRMKMFFDAQLRKDMSEKFEVVSDPGPGVGRIRIAITDLKKGTPALNVLPQTKVTGLGLGAASSEMELVDSQSEEQIAAAIVSQTGSRLSLAGLSGWGDAEAVMKDWSKRIVSAIEAANKNAAK